MGWEETERSALTSGFGTYDRAVAAIEDWLNSNDFIAGDRFTMADTYVGSHVIWGIQFGTLPETAAFNAYAARLVNRPAYIEAKAIDAELAGPAPSQG
jgi:glutathione S-transferase